MANADSSSCIATGLVDRYGMCHEMLEIDGAKI
jgi:hypothetical protein